MVCHGHWAQTTEFTLTSDGLARFTGTMKTPTTLICPACGSPDSTGHGHDETVHNGTRSLRACTSCGTVFSETTGTPMQDIKTPISQVAAALRWRGEGLGLRATARVLGAHKHTIAEWERRFAGMNPPLMLYGLCHTFIQLAFEGTGLKPL